MRPRAVAVFALGADVPCLARLAVPPEAGPEIRLAGRLRLERSATLMALLELPDGRILHDRRAVPIVP